MPRRNYSWEDEPKRRRKWWKWLVIWPLVLAILAGAVCVGVVMFVRSQFRELATQYDLAKLEKMESASFIYDRKGALMGKIFIQNRDPVPYDKISANLVNAVVSAEDQHFWTHGGVDYQGVARAAVANLTSNRLRQGASTVTQQLARNSFGLLERTYRRKLLEMALAERIEEHLPKQKIMELYLNLVYFGGGLYGAEAAARGYFGVSADELTPAQAATLAGLLKSPNGLSPWSNLAASKSSRDYVLRQMFDLGYIDRAAYERALAEPLNTRQRPEPAKTSYPMEYVRQQAIESLGFDRAMGGGFRIYTTIDSSMQESAERALQRKLDEIERRPGYANQSYEQFQRLYATKPPKPGDSNTRAPDYLQGAILALENKTGGILAMVGGRDFRHSEYNRSVQGRRPLGTAFAPLVYAAAFEKGLFAGTVVQDWALDNRLVGIGGGDGILGEWGVERADNEYEGDVSARDALARGKNAAVVRLGFQAGLDSVSGVARAAGIESPLRPYANSYLGTSEVTLEEATLAYTMFPLGGMRPERAHVIDRIEEAEGDVIYRFAGGTKKVVGDATAWQVHSILSDALFRGTGDRAANDYGLAVAGAAGKTGTAYNFTDVWFMGYSEAITCGVWVGFDRPQQIFRGAFSRDLALPIWVDVMNASRADFPSSPLKPPVTVEEVEICRASGELATDKCFEVRRDASGIETTNSTVHPEFVRIGKAPTVQCSVHAGGVKSFVKEFSEEQWPRAAAVVDLTRIRPVDVSSSPVVGGGDPYNSVSPASMASLGGSVPVAQAVAAVAPAPQPQSTNGAVGAPQVTAPEAAGVDDLLRSDREETVLPKPAPIRF